MVIIAKIAVKLEIWRKPSAQSAKLETLKLGVYLQFNRINC
ncbi:MAG: hypothetical protein OFPII_29160 [Osedax symbiont Rs1]|nr:MAG: hypothetical protein OFPII_29160 [Osedax symbiont Rs1]